MTTSVLSSIQNDFYGITECWCGESALCVSNVQGQLWGGDVLCVRALTHRADASNLKSPEKQKEAGMRCVMSHVNVTNWSHHNTVLRLAACAVTTGRRMMIPQHNEPCMTAASSLTGNTVTACVCVCVCLFLTHTLRSCIFLSLRFTVFVYFS